MANLTVYKYPTAAGAEAALEKLKSLQAQGLITVIDVLEQALGCAPASVKE